MQGEPFYMEIPLARAMFFDGFFRSIPKEFDHLHTDVFEY